MNTITYKTKISSKEYRDFCVVYKYSKYYKPARGSSSIKYIAAVMILDFLY